MNPGNYSITDGKITITPTGEIVIRNLKLTPVIKYQKLLDLADYWNENILPFSSFKNELARYAMLDGNRLKLTGKQLAGCYNFLSTSGVVSKDLPLTKFFKLMQSVFELKIKDHRSLQGLKRDSKEFESIFRSFVSISNEKEHR